MFKICISQFSLLFIFITQIGNLGTERISKAPIIYGIYLPKDSTGKIVYFWMVRNWVMQFIVFTTVVYGKKRPVQFFISCKVEISEHFRRGKIMKVRRPKNSCVGVIPKVWVFCWDCEGWLENGVYTVIMLIILSSTRVMCCFTILKAVLRYNCVLL